MRRLLALATASACLLAAAGCGESQAGEGTSAAPQPPPASRSPDPGATTAPTAPVPDPPPLPTLEAYFDHLNSGDPEAAWALLAPAVRDQLGGYDVWSDGISRRETTTPTLTPAGGSRRAPEFMVQQAVVDETPCGLPADRTFTGTWTLGPDGDGGWLIAAAEQTLVSGPPDLETLCASSGY